MLEDELFAVRFKSLLEELSGSAKKYPLTLKEITREVEAVRQKAPAQRSPFDVTGLRKNISRKEIIKAIHESRKRV